jgi:hypothetical protein
MEALVHAARRFAWLLVPVFGFAVLAVVVVPQWNYDGSYGPEHPWTIALAAFASWMLPLLIAAGVLWRWSRPAAIVLALVVLGSGYVWGAYLTTVRTGIDVYCDEEGVCDDLDTMDEALRAGGPWVLGQPGEGADCPPLRRTIGTFALCSTDMGHPEPSTPDVEAQPQDLQAQREAELRQGASERGQDLDLARQLTDYPRCYAATVSELRLADGTDDWDAKQADGRIDRDGVAVIKRSDGSVHRVPPRAWVCAEIQNWLRYGSLYPPGATPSR